MKEKWKPIPIKEFSDKYMVSNLGKVKSIPHYDPIVKLEVITGNMQRCKIKNEKEYSLGNLSWQKFR